MHKHTLRALGLSLMAALGLMAFMAVGAQAETAAQIKVLGSSTLEANLVAKSVLGRLLVPTLKIEIHCLKDTASGIVLPIANLIHITVIFEDCLEINSYDPATGKLLEKLPCKISNGGANANITANATVSALLHKGTVYAIAKGVGAEELFTELKFATGEGCTLPNPVKIKGQYAFNMTQGEAAKISLTPGNEALQTLLKKELKFGVNKAFLIEGAATAELTGAHAGCTWGAI